MGEKEESSRISAEKRKDKHVVRLAGRREENLVGQHRVRTRRTVARIPLGALGRDEFGVDEERTSSSGE